MTTLPDLEPAALAKWLEGEAEHQERIAARYKAASTSRQTYARRAEIFRASAAALAARSVPEAGKAVDPTVTEGRLEDKLAEVLGVKQYPSFAALGFDELLDIVRDRLASVPAPSGADINSGMVTDHLLSDPSHVSDSPAVRESGESTAPIPTDVARLVIAARIVAFESQDAEALRELDKASEAFADRVPWDDEPRTRAPQAVPADDVAGLIQKLRAATMDFAWADLPDDAPIPAVPLLRETRAALTSLSAERDVAKFDLAVQSGKTRLAEQKLTASEAEATSLRRALAEAREQINRYADTAAEHDLVARIDALTGASE